MNARAYVAAFNFKGSDQQKKVGVLSGGERNRVHLAKVLKAGGNVLLLDEPTNDLDVDTLRALEEGLEAFAGCAVVISHDRWFLDRDRHPHPGLRGRLAGPLVRGQLQRVRGGPPQGAGRRRRPAPPHQVQAPWSAERPARRAPEPACGWVVRPTRSSLNFRRWRPIDGACHRRRPRRRGPSSPVAP